MQPLIIGLTGGIGTGKSLIAKIFEHIGINVYYSDKMAKTLYKNSEIIEWLQQKFGTDIVSKGKIDTQKLANLVFKDSLKLKELNNFVHPLVMQNFISWKQNIKAPYVIMESAIIYENKLNLMFDKIICVSTPLNLVMKRISLRDKLSEQEIMIRINNQMPAWQKEKLCDYIIINDNINLVIPQVLSIDSNLRNIKIN